MIKIFMGHGGWDGVGVMRFVFGGGVGCWFNYWGDLLKMHTQALRGNDFSMLLFATRWYNFVHIMIFLQYPSMLHFFITGDVDFSFE